MRPGKVVAIIIERFIGILRCVKPAALAIAQDSIHPMDHFERNPCVFRLDEALKAVDIILQELGIVIGHLFEVRNNPAIIDGVAMEPAGEMVVHSSARHFVER